MRNDDFDDMREIDRWLLKLLAVIVVIIGIGLIWSEAKAHDWFPPNCCSGFDCKVVPQSQVETSAAARDRRCALQPVPRGRNP